MYVPGIFHGVRFAENEPYADRREFFLLDVFHHVKPHERFLLGGFHHVKPHERFSLFVFRYAFSHDCFLPHIFHHAVLHRLLMIPIIGGCEQHSLRSTFAAVFV